MKKCSKEITKKQEMIILLNYLYEESQILQSELNDIAKSRYQWSEYQDRYYKPRWGHYELIKGSKKMNMNTNYELAVKSAFNEIASCKNKAIKSFILQNTNGTSLEISEFFISQYCTIREDIDVQKQCLTFTLDLLDADSIIDIIQNKNSKSDAIHKKILKLGDRSVKNMGFTVKDLKELIKDAPDDLPVEVIGRYVHQEDMVMTDVGIDKESLWFELGYEFDRAGYLR